MKLTSKSLALVTALSAGISLGTPPLTLGADDPPAHSEDARHAEASPPTQKLNALNGEAFESTFLDQMIQHHQMAVQMAKLAQSRADRPEIKEMAQNIISSQSEEIKQMTQWLSQWYRKKPSPMDMSDPSMQKMMDDMEKLQQAKGREFNKLFLSMMTEHHQQALVMAKLAEQRALHPEVRGLASNIQKVQRAEIGQMKTWRATGW